MNEKTRYDQVLQKLRRECGMLIQKYSAKLHKASHEDQPDEKLSAISFNIPNAPSRILK